MYHRLPSSALILILMAGFVGAQTPMGFVESEMFVADRGNMNNSSDGGIRRYTNSYDLIQTLTGGSGAIRGITVDSVGDVYVARGNSIVKWERSTGYATGNVIDSGSKAQDVAVDLITGNIWASYGTDNASAQIRELSPTGTLLQTLTDTLLEHPRSIAFHQDPVTTTTGRLYIANGTGENVLVLDTATSMFTEHVDLSSQPQGFNAIGISVDAPGFVYVTGDYGTTNRILQLVGTTNPAVTTLVDFSGFTDLTSPAGIFADSYGSLVTAGRNKNMGTPGIYLIDVVNSLFVQAPYSGVEVNPIDVAFLPAPFTVTAVSGEIDPGTMMPRVDANGIPTVTIGAGLQPTVDFNVSAPNNPGQTYAVVMSLQPSLTCSVQPTIPQPGTGIFVTPGEPRRLPLQFDLVYLQSILAAGNGSGPIDANFSALICPGSVPGTGILFSGLLDASGQATATFQFPSLPCLGPNVVIYFGAAAVVIDAVTGPLGIELMSSVPACFKADESP